MEKVYFPEIDDEGNIDFGNGCMTEEAAEDVDELEEPDVLA
jgi:hypothetical protein